MNKDDILFINRFLAKLIEEPNLNNENKKELIEFCTQISKLIAENESSEVITKVIKASSSIATILKILYDYFTNK